MNCKIGIIGAGMAGLQAARYFEQVGIDYTLIEGSNRIGGRVYPFPYQNGYLHYGAEYVNGYDNEIYEIVEKLELFNKPESRTSDLWMLDEGAVTVVDGKILNQELLSIWREFIETTNSMIYESSAEEPEKSVGGKIDEIFLKFLEDQNFDLKTKEIFQKLCTIFKNYFQTEWSSPVSQLGLSNMDIWDDGTTVEDSAVLNEHGFQKILEEFRAGIPKEKIMLNAKVINVNYENSQGKVEVLLENQNEKLNFDSVIVTSSLGFLKKHNATLFTPELPKEKKEVIEKMGFGSNMKIFLEYDHPWWNRSTSTIMIVGGKGSGISEHLMVFQPSSWAENVLVAWTAGNGPLEISQKSDSELKEILDSHLQSHLGSNFPVPKSVRIFRFDWLTDEFALGSYSYLSPGQTDIGCIGNPIFSGTRPSICFAGEHTDLTMYQTTVGAARSGLREAMRIAAFFTTTD